MAVPAWFFSPTNMMARGVALVPFASGMAVPDWTTPQFFPFIDSVFSAPVVLASGSPGLSAASADGSGGMWLASYAGTLWHQPPAGSPSLTLPLPSGQVYIGVSPSGHVLSSSGIVYTSAATQLGAFPTAAVGAMSTSGSTMAAILPASGIGFMNSAGVTGHVALPAAMPAISCIAVSSGRPLASAGWAPALPLSGAAAAGLDPQNNEIMLAVGSGFALIWDTTLPFSENWVQDQTITGTANLTSMCWVPDGVQVLATSPASNEVQVIGFSAGVLSLEQTLAISGACSVAVAGSSTDALVAQSGQSQLATLTAIGTTWSSGSPVTGLAGITCVTPFGVTGAIAAVSGGLAYLGLIGDTWSLQQILPLGFAPTALAVDPFLQVYSAGSGQVAVSSGMVLTGSGAFTGTSPTSVAVQQGRMVVAVPGSGLAIFGNTEPGVWTQLGYQSGNITGLALSNTVLFALASGQTNTFGFSGTPYALTPVLSGVVGLWNGSTWTTAGLGVGHSPSAIAFDASGHVQVCTIQNTWWTFTSGGTFVSSGIVPQFPPQPQTVPLGPSAILSASGGLFVATSLSGVLIQVE